MIKRTAPKANRNCLKCNVACHVCDKESQDWDNWYCCFEHFTAKREACVKEVVEAFPDTSEEALDMLLECAEEYHLV